MSEKISLDSSAKNIVSYNRHIVYPVGVQVYYDG